MLILKKGGEFAATFLTCLGGEVKPPLTPTLCQGLLSGKVSKKPQLSFLPEKVLRFFQGQVYGGRLKPGMANQPLQRPPDWKDVLMSKG